MCRGSTPKAWKCESTIPVCVYSPTHVVYRRKNLGDEILEWMYGTNYNERDRLHTLREIWARKYKVDQIGESKALTVVGMKTDEFWDAYMN